MKLKELRENEPLKVIEVSEHVEMSNFNYVQNINPVTIEYKRIQMKIFTDGEIEKESEEISQNVEEYYLNKRKYQYDVDTLKVKNIYFKNYSYIITFLIASEVMTVGTINGWYDVVKDIKVYLKNSKDKKALKNAKQAIKEINNVDYSMPEMLLSQEKKTNNFETEKISKNVYCLKKIK